MARRRKQSMNPLLRTLLWCLLSLLVLVAVDQSLVRAPTDQPALRAVQSFYRDFRQRLLALWHPATIDGVIERERRPASPPPSLRPTPVPKAPAPANPPVATPLTPSPTSPPAVDDGGRYLYVDQHGQLQFADSIEEIPQQFRGAARTMQP